MTDSKFCEHGVNVGLKNPPVFCGQCPPATIATLRADLARVTGERDEAIAMLASWVVSVQDNGGSWDDWDEDYKDAAYRPCGIRALIDAAAKAEREVNRAHAKGGE